ncbi:MAG: hypothetical protein E3J35_09545 [Methanomassiliicoccales archaeon]|nr:MAG: hypothetical protein E3J35_09545 [Methanomassiliicoccales archaeon]
MSLRGDKDTTKDIDMVFGTKEGATAFVSALKRSSFTEERDLPDMYGQLDAFAIMKDDDLFWVDVFYRRVCKKFYLSSGVKERAEEWGSFGDFRLLLTSREDIFLSKSVTERDRDLEDMMVLYREVLDSDVIFEECDTQTENSEKIWHLFLAKKIDEMEEMYEVTVPWKEDLVEIGGRILLERKVPDLVADRPSTVAQIAEEYYVEEDVVKSVLTELEDKGVIKVDRKRRPNLYFLDNE